MEMINFKGLSDEALMAFWGRYHRASRKDAAAIVGDQRPGYTNVAAQLASVACNKAIVMQCVERGDSQDTIDIYNHAVRLGMGRLPADVRARVRL